MSTATLVTYVSLWSCCCSLPASSTVKEIVPDHREQIPMPLVIRVVKVLLEEFVVLVDDCFRHHRVVGVAFDEFPTELSPCASVSVGRVRVIAETGIEVFNVEIGKQVHLIKLLLQEQSQIGPFGSTALEVEYRKDIELDRIPDLVLLKFRIGRALVLEDTVSLFVVLVLP